MVVGALGTVKKGMVDNIKKVKERATVTEIQKICVLVSTQILGKVHSVLTDFFFCARLKHKKSTRKDSYNIDNFIIRRIIIIIIIIKMMMMMIAK